MQFPNCSRLVTLLATFSSFLIVHSQNPENVQSEETKITYSQTGQTVSHHPDVLKCAVCRKRLGLPPLAEQPELAAGSTYAGFDNSSSNNSKSIRSSESIETKQSAFNEPTHSLMQLPIPLEAKQKLMADIQLPPGAKILSAQFVDASETNEVSSNSASTQNELQSDDEIKPLATKSSQPSGASENDKTPVTPNATDNSKEIRTNDSGVGEAGDDRILDSADTHKTSQQDLKSGNEAQPKDAIDSQSIEAIKLDGNTSPPQFSPGMEKEAPATPPERDSRRLPLGGEAMAAKPEQFNVDTTRTSVASIQIENEILKRQLNEREKLVEQLGTIQMGIERQLDEVSRNYEAVRKLSQQNQTDFDKERKDLQVNLQKRDQYIAALKTELNNLRQQSHQEIMQLTDKIAELEKTRTKEITDITLELIELRDKYRASSARESTLQSVKEQREKHMEENKNFDSINTQQKQIIEKQSKTILRLQKQIKDAQLSQRDDESQVVRLQKELSDAHEQLRRYKAFELDQNRNLPSLSNPSLSNPSLSDPSPSNPSRQPSSLPKKNGLLKQLN